MLYPPWREESNAGILNDVFTKDLSHVYFICLCLLSSELQQVVLRGLVGNMILIRITPVIPCIIQ